MGISGILNKVERKEKLNILTVPTHEAVETNLSKIPGVQFWAYRGPGLKDWNTSFRKIPENYVLLNPEKGDNQVPGWVEFDLVISHQKFGQYQVLAPFAQKLGIPLISLEHTGPVPTWPSQQLAQLKSMKGNINIFITDWSRKAWGWGENEAIVINHGLDTEVYKPLNIPKKQYILTTCNEYSRRDWCCGWSLYNEVTKDLPRLNVGNDPPYSKGANSLNELINYHNEAYVFLNTSIVSPTPMSLLEAMACGDIIVTTGTCDIPNVIQHGVNGLIANNANEMRGYLIDILNFPDKYKELGVNARKTILERFTLQRFVDDWNKVLENFR